MAATEAPAERGTTATVVVGLRVEAFDRLTTEMGADSDTARARLLDIDRTTIHRMRRRLHTPTLETAMRIAARLGSTVDALFERGSA